ncbi:hypothetical protein MNQ95_09210 [Pseudoxanthomonas daejeonensis]|uniref:Uncharacterized protein n=1 Tax=Pseudoxanthomonas daejeonensis TaxID=266062 RepID=A0ABQ6ZAZ0_9GAMM|nr:hypothetical protein [Pseudoxanthomonas daejeonensis]KAF1697033.1 hypothetical protein CSC65_03100 [Pseudoxanthomonas daejeonensis]UNK56352.1 hypothetical protein MNQ95_09210 [Pseudoxanthomonas daejeonensis]
MIDAIGWAASIILLATLVRQIVKQAGNSDGEGVSTWLFLGQATASALFVVYAVLLGNWVFIVTNSCLLLTALAGQWISFRRRRQGTHAHGSSRSTT